ncbi:MAG: hypothetical protein HY812_09595 [Planctomycetes bacterium]|nr:hypothetical protein [Planctomycetota bacterium]
MRIPDTQIEVDDFRQRGAELYALTHYHADHRQGLANRDTRKILCSPVTARLLVAMKGIAPERITVIRPGETLRLSRGASIKAFEANHCPGALMFLFEAAGRRCLHTGDFRYCAEHDQHPDLFAGIDTLFVDCTYLNDEDNRTLPSQEQAIQQVIELIERHRRKEVFLGVYTIGKNRLIQAIHERVGYPVYLTEEFHRVYELIGMGACVTRDRAETPLRAYAMGFFQEHFAKRFPNHARDAIVILPTGFTRGRPRERNFFYVPYSEHNSGDELRAFLGRVGARQVIDINEHLR